MLIQQTFALFVFRADRRLGYGDYVGEPTGYKRGMDAVEPLSDFEA